MFLIVCTMVFRRNLLDCDKEGFSHSTGIREPRLSLHDHERPEWQRCVRETGSDGCWPGFMADRIAVLLCRGRCLKLRLAIQSYPARHSSWSRPFDALQEASL